jgi:Aspartyl/Asparaginyl beta-hydroxylase
VFDTSLMHDAVNESDQMRYILMMRIWHPDLTQIERQALQHTYDCLNVPNLVSDDPKLRIIAERHAQAMHAFPRIERTITPSAASMGFGGNKKKTKANGGRSAKGFGIN